MNRNDNEYRDRSGLAKARMTTSTHRYREYKLVLHRESNERYQVTIFDPNGKRVASTGTHLERQGAFTEVSRYVEHILAQGRAT